MNGLAIGDYIRAYHAGIHRVIDFYYCGSGTGNVYPLVKYEKVFNENLTPAKANIIHHCHANNCKKISSKNLREEQAKVYKLYKNIIEYLER